MTNNNNRDDGRRYRGDDSNSNNYTPRRGRPSSYDENEISSNSDRSSNSYNGYSDYSSYENQNIERNRDRTRDTQRNSRNYDSYGNEYSSLNGSSGNRSSRSRIPQYEDDEYVYSDNNDVSARRAARREQSARDTSSQRSRTGGGQRDRFQSSSSYDISDYETKYDSSYRRNRGQNRANQSTDEYSDDYNYGERRKRNYEDDLENVNLYSNSRRNSNGRVQRGNQKKKSPIIPILLVAVLLIGVVVSANALGLFGDKEKLPQKEETSDVTSTDATPEPTPEPTPSPVPQPNTTYGHLYPELQVEKVNVVQPAEGEKVIYLTFDDGPCSTQKQLLDVLDQYNVKATIFASAQFYNDEEIVSELKDAHDRGHTVSVHTYSHDYHEIYASVEAYLNDFNKMNELVKKATGENTQIYRHPGGSNTGYNEDIRNELFKEMNGRGFVYYDWDIGNGDSEGYDMSGQIDRIMGNVVYYDRAILLMHNTPDKDSTIQSLHTIIPQLLDMGYEFRAMDATVPYVQYAKLEVTE